jgi:lipoprotein signal peptidase
VITGRQVGIAAGIAAGGIAIDQASKAFVRSHAHEQVLHTHDGRVGTLPVVWDPSFTDEFAIVHVENGNDPLALGGGEDGSKLPAMLGMVAIPIVGAGAMYAGSKLGGRMGAVGAIGGGLLAAGALSNGGEKLIRDQATDMLFVSRQGIAWNGADVAIGVGGLASMAVIGAGIVKGAPTAYRAVRALALR